MNGSMSSSVLQKRPLVRCEPQYGALVCLEYNNGFPRGKIIVRHLNHRHHLMIDVYGPALRPYPILFREIMPGFLVSVDLIGYHEKNF